MPSIEDRYDAFVAQLRRYLDRDLRVCTSSSYQSHSIPLLHLIARSGLPVPVFFIDTGFHFPETLAYRDQLTSLLDLDLRIVESAIPKAAQRTIGGQLLFATDPDECCRLNKVDPMNHALGSFDVWISGVRRDQTETRAAMGVEEMRSDGVLRFNAMLDWDDAAIAEYREQYGLPAHPLDDGSSSSIGCAPCTRLGADRDGRWDGMAKTECGLHLDVAR